MIFSAVGYAASWPAMGISGLHMDVLRLYGAPGDGLCWSSLGSTIFMAGASHACANLRWSYLPSPIKSRASLFLYTSGICLKAEADP